MKNDPPQAVLQVTISPGNARWDGAFVSVAVLLAVLASRPFVAMGLIDDFSYIRTAFVFARTGHFVYNGWATAMLGWQIPWGALFLKLFGFTHTAARLSTLFLAICSVWLVHAIGRRLGLNRRNAIFAALAVGLCPLFLPLSITFMTDVSGLFVIVVCLYACLRALSASTPRATLAWLIAAGLLGALGGTARQIAWVAPLVMVPCTAWMLRKHRAVLFTAVLLWLVTLATIFESGRWFRLQPLSVPEPLLQAPIHLGTMRELAGNLTGSLLYIVLLSMPVLVAWLLLLRSLRPRVIAILAAVALVATVGVRFLTFHVMERGFMPWVGDVLDKIGVFDYPNAWFLGVSPTPFNFSMRVLSSVLVIATLVVFLYTATRPRTAGSPVSVGSPSWFTLLTLTVPFTLAYFTLLIPRGLFDGILDRYLLPLIVLAILCLVRLHQDRVSSHLPPLSWIVLVAFALFGVMGTHDWVESHRARLAAVAALHAAGIPDNRIEAGFEYDGTTQIDRTGTIVDPRVNLPAGIERTYAPPGLPAACETLFNPHTPAVHAEYFLAFQQLPCLTGSRFQSVSYRTWLPPFQRQILILKLQ